MFSTPSWKNTGKRCFHFDESGNERNPPCSRSSYNCGFVHPDEPEWSSAKPSAPFHGRKSDHGRSRFNDDYDDRPPPLTQQQQQRINSNLERKEAVATLLTKIKDEKAAKQMEAASNNPAASSSRTKSSSARETVPSAPRLNNISTSAAAASSSSPPSPIKTSSAPMSAVNPARGTQQQPVASSSVPTTKPTNKSTTKPTSRPAPIVPPPPNTAFAKSFLSMSLNSPGFPPNTNSSQPQTKTGDENAMHVDQPPSSSGASGSGTANKATVTSDAQQPQYNFTSPVNSAQPPPPPNPPPDLPYPPPPPPPTFPDGFKLSDNRSRHPSVALSEAGSASGSGRRPSLSIAQDDPKYLKWINVVQTLSRCIDIETELRTIDKNIQDAQCFISIGAVQRLDSSLNDTMAAPTTVPWTPTFGVSSFSNPGPIPTTPTSATTPGFSTSAGLGLSTVLPPMDISEELTALIARRQALLAEKTEKEEELIQLDTWPSPPHAHQGGSDNDSAEGDGTKVDYNGLVNAVTHFKDMVGTMMQLLSEHVSFFEKRKKMPGMPDELINLGMEEGGGEEDDRELDRQLEGELEREGGKQEEGEDVAAEVVNLSLGDIDKDGDVAMQDVPEGSSAAHQRGYGVTKVEKTEEAARGHKRRRLNTEGYAEPTMEEMEQVLNALQALEDQITTLQNDGTQAEAAWKEAYEGIVEERVNALAPEKFDKKLLRYRSRVKALEKEKKKWEEKEKEIEREREREREEREQEQQRGMVLEEGQEAEWMGMLYNEVVPVGVEGHSQTSFAKLWGDVKGVEGDLNTVRKDIEVTKEDLEEFRRELALEKVAMAKVQGEAESINERLQKQTQTQQELSSALSAVETYIRSTAEEIVAHRSQAPPPPPSPPPMPSQSVILKAIEPLLLDAVREDIRPNLQKLRDDTEYAVQEGAKQSFAQFVSKMRLTMNILDAIHRRLDEEPTMLESLAGSIHPAEGSTSSS